MLFWTALLKQTDDYKRSKIHSAATSKNGKLEKTKKKNEKYE